MHERESVSPSFIKLERIVTDAMNESTVQDPASFVLLLASLAASCEAIPWQCLDNGSYLPVASVAPPVVCPLRSSEDKICFRTSFNRFQLNKILNSKD
jgi:hypothetical protein